MTRALASSFLAALRPAPKLPPAVWAEQNIVLNTGSNARPGALKLTRAQTGIVNAFAEPTTRTIALQLSAQFGKSLVADIFLFNALANNPGPCLHVSPTEQKAFAFVRDRFDPLVAGSPALRAIIGHGPKGVDSKYAKTVPGGSISFASSHKPDDLSSRAVKYLALDEIDRYASSAGTEGNPIDLAIARTKTFNDAKILLCSTPTFLGTSRIHQWAQRGDCRRYFVPCLECGTLAPLSKERLAFDPADPEKSARLRCEDCGHHATERERLAMVRDDRADWLATNDNAEPGVVSFLANELVSEFSSLARIARAVASAQTLEAKRVLTNVTWAEAFEHTSEVELSAGELQARAEPIGAPYPARITTIVCGVDVQMNRLEAIFMGFDASTKERWVLDYSIFMGDTSGPAVWADLDAALGRTFELENGARLPLTATLVDSGFNTTVVAQWVAAQRAKRRVFATKGVSGFDKPSVREGSLLKGQRHRQLLIGVDNVKLNAVKALALAPGEPGSVHLPDHFQSDFFDQLGAERLEATYLRGFPRYAWTKARDQRNEVFDVFVLSLAAEQIATRPMAAVNAPKKTTIPLSDRIKAMHASINQ